jgi:hypothetical protein
LEFAGQQQLRRGVGGCDQVFEQIRRVVPAAGAIQLGPVGQGTVSGPTVVGVTGLAQPGIVAALLFAHELEQLIGQRLIRLVVNGKNR